MEDLKIRLANTSEIKIVFNLLKDAAFWLKRKEINYWQNWIDPEEVYTNWIKEGFNNS
jgi:hypothetical protein